VLPRQGALAEEDRREQMTVFQCMKKQEARLCCSDSC
jgi:hypothetical protein